MIEPTINELQAKEFAYAFISDISNYIASHKAEYLSYLKETSQVDETYQYGNAEVGQWQQAKKMQ